VAGVGGVDLVCGGLYDNIRRQYEEVEEEVKKSRPAGFFIVSVFDTKLTRGIILCL
jgi:hypothetical protein